MDINTAVSPEVHPGVTAGLLNEHVAETDAIVTTTHAALEATFKTLGSISAARQELDEQARAGFVPKNHAERMQAHGLRMAGGRPQVTTPHQALYDAGNATIERANQRLDHAYGKLQAAETSLDQAITEGLRDLKFGAQVAVETRTMLRTMEDGAKRLGMVMGAAQRGDLPMVAAVLTGPAYLSGLTDEQRDLVREAAAHAVVPALKARRDAARKAQELIRRAGSHTIAEIDRLRRYQQTGAARMSAAIAAIGASHG